MSAELRAAIEADTFNVTYGIGTRCRYWLCAREGEASGEALTTSYASVVEEAACVWLAGGFRVRLTNVEPVPGRPTAAAIDTALGPHPDARHRAVEYLCVFPEDDRAALVVANAKMAHLVTLLDSLVRARDIISQNTVAARGLCAELKMLDPATFGTIREQMRSVEETLGWRGV